MRTTSWGLAALLVTGALTTTAAQGHQGAMGVWRLNVEKSTMEPGPKPKEQSSTFTQLPDGSVKIETDVTDASGQTGHREMVSRFDGKQAARTGAPQASTRAYRWLDDLNFEFEEMIDGQRSVIGRTTMSKDGKVRTLTVNGMRNGQAVHNIEVYERWYTAKAARLDKQATGGAPR
jgi:hypothetical protein